MWSLVNVCLSVGTISLIFVKAFEMSGMKLIYYNGRGRAETIRLVFALAGKEFDDHRIKPEDMPALKPTLPFGQVPVLEHNGEMMGQSMTIARFVAREFGLAGDTNLEAAHVDEIVDVITDFQNALYDVFFTKDEELKKEKKKKVYEETIPTSLKNLEKKVEQRGGDFFIGKKVTWAEMHFFQIIDALIAEPESKEILEPYPKLKNLFESVQKIPNVAKYLKERPVTPF